MHSQSDFSLESTPNESSFFERSVLPISLVLSGSLMSSSFFEKEIQRDLRNLVGNDYYYGIDDYTRYVPIAEMYVADLMGVKSRSHWFDQTKNLILVVTLTDLFTYRLKKGIIKTRPNSYDKNSFPSGHTSLAFANASVLFKEFRDSNKLLAYSGYAFAITTGAFRMINNAHYLSDVLVSAGIAMIVTELVYEFDSLISWNPFKKSSTEIKFVPQIIEQNKIGAYFSIRF